MNIIELRGVEKSYGRGGAWRWGGGKTIRALAGVTIGIPEGRRIAVTGASGAGKSTLARLILGLERPDAGAVLFRGRDRSALRGAAAKEARRAVQAVFQNFRDAVNPRFTAFDIIGEPLKNFDGMKTAPRRARVEELLHQVGLTGNDMQKRPHEFSGGELQRICIARALAPRPALVVLDEALASLDTPNQSRILRLLDELGKTTGCAYVFITHDQQVAENFADETVTLENGRLFSAPGTAL